MALTTFRRVSIFPNQFVQGGNNGLSFNIDATGEAWGAAFMVSESFTLAKVALYINSENGTSPAYIWSIETDDGAGRPSGSLAWANASVSVTVTAAGWTALQTLTASGAVAPGTLYHLVVRESGVAPTGVNYVSMRENGMIAPYSGYVPCYSSRRTGGAWAGGTGGPNFVLANSDSSVMIGQVMDNAQALTITDTAWKGLKWVAPFSGTLWGAAFGKLNSTSAGAVAAKLISSGNSVLKTGTNPAGWFDGYGTRDMDPFVFDTPYDVTAGETYRVVWKDPAGQQRMDTIYCSDATFKAAMYGADQYALTEGTSSDGTASPTVWTDSDDELPKVELIFSSVTASGDSIVIPVAQSVLMYGKSGVSSY